MEIIDMHRGVCDKRTNPNDSYFRFDDDNKIQYTYSHNHHGRKNSLLSNLYYKLHQIQKLKCFSCRLAVVFAQSIEARCQVKNEDVVGAVPTGEAPMTSQWSTNLLATKVHFISKVLW